MSWTCIARSHIVTLQAHRVPQAWGFVSGKRIGEQPESAAVLDDWRRAGYPLGNHTYSHLGLSQAASLQAWIGDALAGEAAIAARMAGADWRVLRFPFLDGGTQAARHDGAAAWLQSQGYRVAEVSLSFDDWAYAGAYARCMDKDDQAAVATMKALYLQRVDAAIVRARALSHRVYGRMIAQVLLTHMGPWGAATLPDAMARLDAAGARYVTLDHAQADAAYGAPSPRAGNGMLMERWATPASTLPVSLRCRRSATSMRSAAGSKVRSKVGINDGNIATAVRLARLRTACGRHAHDLMRSKPKCGSEKADLKPVIGKRP